MTPRSPSVGFRAVLALGLMIGFYALALGLAGALLWVPYAAFNYAHRIPAKLALGCLAGAGIILWSVMPRPDRFEPPGPRLEPGQHPKLFEMIRGVASATKQEMPAAVYLVGDMNAWVAHRGGLMGLGAHGIMGLGLPLLQTLSVSELRAVLAHEFGHYHGGDTKLGRFVYVTRAAIGRTLENLGRHGSILQLPFIWYGNLFLRVSHAVSRGQELAADQLAARVVGARPLAEGLKKIHVAAPVFGYYWSNEVTPVLHAGFVPPLAAGFQRFVTGEIGQKAMAAAREHSLKEDAGDVFDTHPPLGERLKALEGARPGAVTGERSALHHAAGGGAGPRARGGRAGDASHRRQASRTDPVERGRRARLSALLAEGDTGGRRTRAPAPRGFARASGEHAVGDARRPSYCRSWHGETQQLRGSWALGAALAVALSQAGWATDAQPGEAVMLRGPAGSIDPFGAMQALVKGEMSAEAWGAECERLEMVGVEVFGAGPSARHVVASASRPVVAPREVVAAAAAAPAPVASATAPASAPAPRTRRCWRCKEPVELPAESGGERPRCAKCGTLQWVPV